MRLVFVPATASDEHAALRGREIEIPDCECCRDTGQVMSPTTVWQGKTYLGHGPACSCYTCEHWSARMQHWADQRVVNRPSQALPKEAIDAVDSGKAQTYDEYYPCPYCANGSAFRLWTGTLGDRKNPSKPFRPTGWKRVDYDAGAGRALVDLYLVEHGEKPIRRVTGQMLKGAAQFLPKALREAPTLHGANDEGYYEVKAELEERERARLESAVREEAEVLHR